MHRKVEIAELNRIYPEQEIEITTCGDVYKKWRLERKYRRIPKGPLRINIKYIDTSISTSPEYRSKDSSPVICAMHGIPGNYGIFNHLIHCFRTKARVIIPTFPSSLYYPMNNNEGEGLFRHSADEKTQLYQDFLLRLGIPQVDVLIAHSSGVYPGLKLCLDESTTPVKSLVLLHPGGYLPVNAMKPLIVTKMFGYIGLNRWIFSFINKHRKAIFERIYPHIDSNFDGICLLTTTMIFSEYEKTEKQYKEICEKKIPTLMIFSEEDVVVNKPVTTGILKAMQCDRNSIWYYGTDGSVKIKGREDGWLKAVSVDSKSHYVFRKHPRIVNLLIEEHLNKLWTEQNS